MKYLGLAYYNPEKFLELIPMDSFLEFPCSAM